MSLGRALGDPGQTGSGASVRCDVLFSANVWPAYSRTTMRVLSLRLSCSAGSLRCSHSAVVRLARHRRYSVGLRQICYGRCTYHVARGQFLQLGHWIAACRSRRRSPPSPAHAPRLAMRCSHHCCPDATRSVVNRRAWLRICTSKERTFTRRCRPRHGCCCTASAGASAATTHPFRPCGKKPPKFRPGVPAALR